MATPAQIAGLAKEAFDAPLGVDAILRERIITATAIALAESGGNETIIPAPNSDGSIDVGLWQINSIHRRDHPLWTPPWLQNPKNNAQAMAEISRNGTYWTPWEAYKNGKYKAFIPAALGGYAAYTGAAADVMDQFSEGGISDLFSNPLDGIMDGFQWFTKTENMLRLAQIVGGIALAVVAAAIFASPAIKKVSPL